MRKTENRLKRRLLLGAVIVALCAAVAIPLIATRSYAQYSPTPNTFTFNSGADLVTYATAYKNGTMYNGSYCNPGDTLVFSLTSTGSNYFDLTDNNFTGIGTSENPFAGTISDTLLGSSFMRF